MVQLESHRKSFKYFYVHFWVRIDDPFIGIYGATSTVI